MSSDDLFDLRHYVFSLLRAWKLILGVAILTMLVIGIVTFTRQREYQAVALVAVTQPNYYMNFDPRFQTVTDVQPNYRAYPDLALNTEILTNLLASWLDHPSTIVTVDDLRAVLSARNLTDPSIVELSVRLPDPEQAAFVANLWAQIFITRAREVYGGTGAGQVTFFEEQVTNANEALVAAEQALVAFDESVSVQELQNELDILLDRQLNLLSRLSSIDVILRDIEAYSTQLEDQAQNTDQVADQLTFLYIQFRTFFSENMNVAEGEAPPPALPFQLQIGGTEPRETLTTAQQRRLLTSMRTILAQQQEAVDQSLLDLRPTILSAQKELREADLRRDQLEQEYNLANETYATLTRKVYEVRISVEDSSGEARLAARAVPPINPTPRNLVRNVMIAGVGAGILMVVVVSLWSWWRKPVSE